MGASYDVIILGAGHNGLVAAGYLARVGRRVLVLERRAVVGGACVTEEVFPGYRVSTAAYVTSLFRPEIVRDLKLESYGYEVLPRDPSSFTPTPDGRSLLLGSDAESNRREIAKFSARDAERYPEYERYLTRIADLIEPLALVTPPDPFSGRIADLLRLAKLFLRLRRSRDLARRLPELLSGSATRLLDGWFESEPLRATLATDAVIGAFLPPSAPGTAYVLLHHVLGETDGRRGVWGYVRGGMGGLSEALARAATDLGVEILCDAAVERIEVVGGRVAGVTLGDGRSFQAPCVASNADPRMTFLELVEPGELPEDFRREIAAIDYRSGSLKINAALSELPEFWALPGKEPGPQHRGTIHIAPTVEDIERAFDDARRGQPSSRPVLEITLPSAVDETVAPPGRHLMSIFVQYAPYEVDWEAEREPFADRCLSLLEEYAPNIRGAVIERQVLTPKDLERDFALTGGNIFHGAMSPDRLFFLRPLPSWSQYRTPIRGLYLCGSGAHPGGGVTGAPGRNAAREILRDRGG